MNILKKTKALHRVFIAFLIPFVVTSWANSQSEKNLSVPEFTPYPGIPTLNNVVAYKLPACSDYMVEEFIVSGTATSYKPIGEFDKDGRWNVQKADKAPYITRIIVMRPKQNEKFNGSVIVEWLNVTGGFDFSPARNTMWKELERSGFVWVGVSAQIVGIEGSQQMSMGGSLKKLNSERYNQLKHPGDAFSYDIYSQAGLYLKGPDAPKVLGGLTPKYVISMGQSQSAFYLITYINAIDPIDKIYDGFLDYGRFAIAAPIEGSNLMSGWLSEDKPVKFRTDLRVPVMVFDTETDVVGMSNAGPMSMVGYYAARQPNTKLFRAWEVAGGAHAGAYLHKVGFVDTCGVSFESLAAAWDAPMGKVTLNNAPQHHYVSQAAIRALQNWVANGIEPPKGEPIELTGTGTKDDPVRPILDKNGNAKGGIRSPWLDVPISRLFGAASYGSLGGGVEPFDVQKLDSLYPGGKVEYLKKFEAALDRQIIAGFILAEDKTEIMEVARLLYKGSL